MSRLTALPILTGLLLAAAPAVAEVTTTTTSPQASAFAGCMQGGGSLSDCRSEASGGSVKPQASGQAGMLGSDAQPQAIIRPGGSASSAATTAAVPSGTAASPWSNYSSANTGTVPEPSADALANPTVNRNDQFPEQPNYPEGAAPYATPEAAAAGTTTGQTAGEAATQAAGGAGAAGPGGGAATDPFMAMRAQSPMAAMFPMNPGKAAPRPPVPLHSGGNSCDDVRRNATGLGVMHIEQANGYGGSVIWVDGSFRRLRVADQMLYLADLDCGLVARNYGRTTQWSLREQGSRKLLGQVMGGVVSWQ